jgi:hypothetical protein
MDASRPGLAGCGILAPPKEVPPLYSGSPSILGIGEMAFPF